MISGKATALVDIGHYLSIAFADWFERKSSSYSTTSGRLLLVDDSAFFRGLIGPVLRGMGYEVVTCASAPEALDRLSRDTRFNVIVSDIDMPEMDGFSFASAVRSRPHMSSIPSSRCPASARRRRSPAAVTSASPTISASSTAPA